ncbi:general substrate transporter [Pluteus cervinus]|uniref:General substrate transporter n=1 Tax=Pluteus cervinus TaxID=181527 RepID=A0ACD3AQT6_9AGAR|nr:general substrate transporter [Pluteus cervinus]
MARPNNPHAFTAHGWFLCSWILITSFQYGYHISALNQIQAVLTCKNENLEEMHITLPTCIPMSDFYFSIVTATFTLGGLFGSSVANIVMDRKGRRGAVTISSVLTVLGATTMGIGSTVEIMVLGRFFIGVAAGIGLCVVPVFLSEIAPARISGKIGVLTQLGIVLGIMATQLIGFKFATPTEWRKVLYISSILALLQLVASWMATESPVWLGNNRLSEERVSASQKIWITVSSSAAIDPEADDPLLGDRRDQEPHESLALHQVLVRPELRRPLTIVCLAMVSQQVSGVNAVLYYSNDILSKALPTLAAHISLGITVVNVLMTFPPIILIEKMGRKPLLSLSLAGVCLSSFAVGYGLNAAIVPLSSLAVIAFIMSFAIGLGPVPFVMISEVSPPGAVSALSSIALSLNWVVNFLVGLLFLPLRNAIAGGDATKEGRIFYVFSGILAICFFFLARVYRG